MKDVYYTDVTYSSIGNSSRKITFKEKCQHCINCNIVYHKNRMNGKMKPILYDVKLTTEQENRIKNRLRLLKIKKLKRKRKWANFFLNHRLMKKLKLEYYHILTHIKQFFQNY